LRSLKKDGDHEWHSIDATIIRSHQHAAGARGGQEKQALGKSRGGFTSKIHAKVDAFGLPLTFKITCGQVHDVTQALELAGSGGCEFLIADRGYDSDAFREALRSQNVTPVIPGRQCRKTHIEIDTHIYKERNVVERFFNRIKGFRRIATRYDKTEKMYLGALTMVGIILWLQV
jgi:transposase